MKTERLIPLAAMERILKSAGAHRVSEEAKVALRQVIEDIAMEIGEEANRLAGHAKRKTIKADDIRLASQQIMTDISKERKISSDFSKIEKAIEEDLKSKVVKKDITA